MSGQEDLNKSHKRILIDDDDDQSDDDTVWNSIIILFNFY